MVTAKDTGDAVTLLQSMTGSTFDSSQLVFTACMGYPNVHESRLQELRNKHRPAVKAAFEERLKGLQAWRDSKGPATKLYNSRDPKSVLLDFSKASLSDGSLSRSESGSSNAEEVFISLTGDGEIDCLQDLQGQVICAFKVLYLINSCVHFVMLIVFVAVLLRLKFPIFSCIYGCSNY